MDRDEFVREVQRLYPLLYFACHGGHARSDGLGESDLRLLHHIDGQPETFASDLARHLDLSRSRISEALKGLERKGLVERRAGRDGRKAISLTAEGTAALTASDGLNPESVGAILDELDAAEQRQVIQALGLVAEAIRRYER